MKLNLMERLVALSILPIHGNITTLRIIDDLKVALSPTEKEHKDCEIVDEENQPIRWNTKEGLVAVDIPIGEKATDIIVDALKSLDAEQKLTKDHVSLYEKFIDNK